MMCGSSNAESTHAAKIDADAKDRAVFGLPFVDGLCGARGAEQSFFHTIPLGNGGAYE
jgi:hypothetical protein